jgi:hypothetical protein
MSDSAFAIGTESRIIGITRGRFPESQIHQMADAVALFMDWSFKPFEEMFGQTLRCGDVGYYI